MSGTDDRLHGLSRRELLKRIGGAAALPSGVLLPVIQPPLAAHAAAAPAQGSPAVGEALENLSAGEAQILEAITARLIPSDDNGPGALEARAARYIDRALGGALASSRDAYRSGLAAVDAFAQASRGAPFARLSSQDQDAVLRDVEAGAAQGVPDSSGFFNLVRFHTLQGTFGDPYYGGNAGFAGWDLVGYPGIRLAVTADDQRLEARPPATHQSAYDHAMFSGRKPARASREREGGHHGD